MEPSKITDLLALMGDASDNIKGVPGFGEKTAVALMKNFKNIEEMLKKPDSIAPEAKRRIFLEHADAARLSKELATLDQGVPLTVTLEQLKIKEPNSEKLTALFKRLEFKTLLKEYAAGRNLESRYHLIRDKRDFEKLFKKIERSDLFAFDFETTGPDPMAARPIGISFSLQEGNAYYIAFKREGAGLTKPKTADELDRNDVLQQLKPIFEDETVKKVGQNIKYEYIILYNYGIDLKGIYFDTMIASYLLRPSKPNHNLDDIAMEYLDYKMIPLSDLIGSGKKEITLEDVPLEKVCKYSCEDADVTFRLMKKLEKQLKEKGLYNLFAEVEIPLITVLAKMEIAGVALDTKFLGNISKEMEKRLFSITKDIYGMAGTEFNINSHQQLSHVLFERLRLPVVKRTKTGISTDEAVLRKLQAQHRIIGLILEYRTLAKLKSTYVDTLPQLINKKTGKIHTSFNQTVTATGRLSSSNPNLQNIPIKTDVGRRIRKAFIPLHKEDILISADYSQIELRILAHLSNDKNLINAFKKGYDIHTYTAQRIFGVKEKEVTKKMRAQAKTVNFGIIYGMSPYGLSRDLGIDVSEAENFINNYFQRYAEVKKYLKHQIEYARSKGYVTTILNRRRYIPEINSKNVTVRQFSERTAVNTPIQGSAADLIKVAMLRIAKTLDERKLKSTMILQVHDELLFEVKMNEAPIMREIIKREMEGVFKLKVPITVHIGEGKNWLEAGE